MSLYACDRCPAAYPTARGLSIHRAHAHQIASDHPKSRANRRWRGDDAPALLPEPGLIGVAIAVIGRARRDARTSRAAAAWLANIEGARQ